jgi:hypothetical protein
MWQPKSDDRKYPITFLAMLGSIVDSVKSVVSYQLWESYGEQRSVQKHEVVWLEQLWYNSLAMNCL